MQQLPLRAWALLRKRSVLAGVAALIAAGILLYAAPIRSPLYRAGPPRPELQELVAATGERRTFEPRVTGNFKYGKLTDTATRSGEPAREDAPLNIRVAEIALEKRASASTDPAALNAFAIAQLITGQTTRAVATLESAVRLAPRDARLSSDMAAGYLVRARQTNQIEDVARAVGFAKGATDADPKLAEARFNLALSLEGLSLRLEATKAWQSYLELDASSEWAAEARRHIERLAETPDGRWEKQRREVIAAGERGDEASIRAATQKFPDTAYEYVENDLIPAWADAWLARDVEKAGRTIRLARAFGQALADGVGDRMPLDATVAIERASATLSHTDSLARGHQMFREARSLYEQDRVADSAQRFIDARNRLLDQQSPFAEWTSVYLAIDAFYRRDLDASARLLDALTRTAKAREYFVLGGRAHRVRGLVHNLTTEPADALDRYRDALTDFTKAGMAEDVAAIHATIAETLEQSGNYRTAWSHWRLALDGLVAARTARLRQRILDTAGNSARRNRLFGAAIQFQNELVADASLSRRAGAIVESLVGRAQTHHLMGHEHSAMADIKSAQEWLGQVVDRNLAARHGAETSLIEGEILAGAEPERAREALNSALTYFTGARMLRRVPRISLALGRIERAAGRYDAAESSFLQGIRELERYRAEVPAGELRLAYFDQPWNVFDEMIELLALQPSRAQSALAFAERARARDLLDTMSRSVGGTVNDPASLESQLPPRTVVVYYASLEKELLAWVISNAGVKLVRMPSGSKELSQHAQRLTAAIQRSDVQESSELSGAMFDLVIRPVSSHLSGRETLVIVPDGALHGIPFAALKDRVTGRYLVEDHAVVVTPSATMFSRASARLTAAPITGNERLLVIGNPRLDSADAEGLSTLPGAEAEARDLATLYKSAVVLTGDHATKPAFLHDAGGFEMVHFGGHAIANERYPLMSRLLLARGKDGRSGLLYAHEILDLPLPQTKLIVLAACRTAAGPVVKGEGPISLARPFLAAGVPSLVATLWDVADHASQVFFETFYRSLRQGNDPVRAVRAAQLALLNHDSEDLRAPSAWAGFLAIGGVKLTGGQ